MSWTKLHLRVETPLFNGDGDQTSAQVRVSSIRGGMHFWLRAMAGVFARKDPNALRRIENYVLGSTESASPIRLRIPQQPEHSTDPFPEFMSRDARDSRNKWIGYLLGPGLTSWESADKERNLPGASKITRAFVPPGEEFDLWVKLIGLDTDAHTVAVGALWMSLVFGGVGARTRRGFGGVRILEADGPALAGWGSDSLRTPNLEFFRKTKHLWFTGEMAGPVMGALRSVAERVEAGSLDGSTSTPSFPVLSKVNTIAGVTGGGAFYDWIGTLRFGGEKLRRFRATEDAPHVSYQPRIKTREWLEVIHDERRDDFRLGGLGLPIVFKNHTEVHANSGTGEESEKLRRASPLWLRAVGEGDEWRLFSFAFLDEFLPQDRSVSVNLWLGEGNSKKQDRQLEVTTEDSHAWVRQWVKKMADS